jgi:hypothetical protein
MDADLDLLLAAVYVTADDLLPARPGNARRSVTDAEVVTLCVAQAIMGIPSDRRFLAVASRHLRYLFPSVPTQPGYFKRRRRLADTVSLIGDKGYTGKAFAQAVSDMNATILRPSRKDEPGRGPHLTPIRQLVNYRASG